MFYQLYIANKNYSSWSLRPWLLMRQLAIPFDEVLEPFSKVSEQTFRRFSPSGKVPCLMTEDGAIWDSLAIVEYLAESYAKVWPEECATRAWARCATAEMHSGFNTLRNLCPMNIGLRIRLNHLTESLKIELERLNELWGQGLEQFNGPFLAGDKFTAVDAFYAPVCFRIQTYELQLSPQAQAYASRILALPEMIEWQSAALKETWREQGHEQEALSSGIIIEDLRDG